MTILKIDDALALAGVSAVGYGLHLAWPPLAWLWVGLSLLAAAVSTATKKAKTP
jgi:hypothetical protein